MPSIGTVIRNRITALIDQGRGFASTSGVLSIIVSTDNYLLYFLAGAKACRISRVIFSSGPGAITTGGIVYLSTTPTGTITGTDLAKLNRLIGKGQTATATVKGTLSGVTGKGDVMYAIPFNTNKPVQLFDFSDGIVLLPGTKLLVSCDVIGATISAACSVEWTEEDV
jgi:hypothetical protein